MAIWRRFIAFSSDQEREQFPGQWGHPGLIFIITERASTETLGLCPWPLLRAVPSAHLLSLPVLWPPRFGLHRPGPRGRRITRACIVGCGWIFFSLFLFFVCLDSWNVCSYYVPSTAADGVTSLAWLVISLQSTETWQRARRTRALFLSPVQ